MKETKAKRPYGRNIHKASYAKRHGSPMRITAKAERVSAIFRQLAKGDLVPMRRESLADRSALRALIHQYGRGIVKLETVYTVYLQFNSEQVAKHQKAMRAAKI